LMLNRRRRHLGTPVLELVPGRIRCRVDVMGARMVEVRSDIMPEQVRPWLPRQGVPEPEQSFACDLNNVFPCHVMISTIPLLLFRPILAIHQYLRIREKYLSHIFAPNGAGTRYGPPVWLSTPELLSRLHRGSHYPGEFGRGVRCRC